MSQSIIQTNNLPKKTYNLSRCMFAGYITNSGNYFDFFIPLTKLSIYSELSIDTSADVEGVCFLNDSQISFAKTDVFDLSQTIFAKRDIGISVELKFKSTQTNKNKPGVIYFNKGGLIVS